MHRLIAPPFLDPRLMNTSQQEASVINSSSVCIGDQVFHLANPEEIALQSSQKVFILLFQHFYLETEEEQKQKRRQVEERQQREKEETKVQLNKWREEAEAFNAHICIPVKWVPGYKDVLSGLTENSWGNGRNKATVNHILLQEDLDDGRLHRKQGDFLCSSSEKQNGKRWHPWNCEDPMSLAYDGNGSEYQGKITCKSCLQIAKRWER